MSYISVNFTQFLDVPNLLVGDVYHVKNEGCLFEVFIMRLFNQTLSIYAEIGWEYLKFPSTQRLRRTHKFSYNAELGYTISFLTRIKISNLSVL